MRSNVRKFGNGAAIRLPARTMEAAGLQLDSAVDLRVVSNGIVIGPVRVREYDLATLVACITPENRHDETDFGPPGGREII